MPNYASHRLFILVRIKQKHDYHMLHLRFSSMSDELMSHLHNSIVAQLRTMTFKYYPRVKIYSSSFCLCKTLSIKRKRAEKQCLAAQYVISSILSAGKKIMNRIKILTN